MALAFGSCAVEIISALMCRVRVFRVRTCLACIPSSRTCTSSYGVLKCYDLGTCFGKFLWLCLEF
ncbi:hypothetical protein M6B38_139205 [Iris pallida]|uniref:Secreted protein n=1 Tax=Iris pallida TaxID=29817 RepID=A0AAX6FC34_IRIPA|nr:hypothetical protein M6B38_139205 [Iris pallida]